MFPTPTERTAAVTADVEAGTVLLSGPAAAMEVEVASLLLTASAAVLMLTGTVIEVLAVLGVLIWVAALLVLVAADASRAAHRRHTHQQDRSRYQRRKRDQFWVWR